MANIERRNLKEEFYSIISPKDCARYSKTAKSNLEDAVSRMEHTLWNLDDRLNNRGYSSYKPEVDDKVIGYYESIIGAYKSALKNFVNSGEWSFTAPSTSQATKDKFEAFMVEDSKYGSWGDGRIEKVSDSFGKLVKNLKKNGFNAADLSKKKADEEEAKKPKMPDKVSYTKADTYDPNRIKGYQTNSRGEKMALESFLTHRGHQFYDARNYTKYPEIGEYVNKIFTALDNAWFAYASGTTPKLDFTEADKIYDDYTSKYTTVKNFDHKVCNVHMSFGGTYTYWDCKNDLNRMANNREKVVKEVTMEKEDTYSTWEKSVDAILNDEGKPSLNAYLDQWVEDVVAYYTDKRNIERWTETDKRLAIEIKGYDEQLEEIASKWSTDHAGDKSMTWKQIHYGYKDDSEYRKIEGKRNIANSSKISNGKYLSIAKMGEKKIRELFKQQAADAKKAFVTAVCEKAGVLKDGKFYWSEQNTGHLNGTVVGQDDAKWRITSFFAGGYNIQRLHTRTKITKLSK